MSAALAPPGAAKVLVLGLGTPECGADAAGRVAAERLAGKAPTGVAVREVRGDALELMDAWRDAGAVILIDAVLTGAVPGTVARFDASAEPLPAIRRKASSHDLGLAEALELARALGSLPPRVVVLAIEGDDFTPGAPLSAAVRRGIELAVERAGSEARDLAGEEERDHA
ncbi:MAG: hydrogenase maturation protease [Pseudohaliea sp.]